MLGDGLGDGWDCQPTVGRLVLVGIVWMRWLGRDDWDGDGDCQDHQDGGQVRRGVSLPSFDWLRQLG